MRNSLESKPQFTIHRDENGTPVVPDSSVLTTLSLRGAIHCGDWLTVDGFVKLTGGAAPTVSLIPLMVANHEGGEEYVVQGTAIGPLVDGESFLVDVYRGRLYLRIDAVTGNPTNVQVLLGGSQLDRS